MHNEQETQREHKAYQHIFAELKVRYYSMEPEEFREFVNNLCGQEYIDLDGAPDDPAIHPVLRLVMESLMGYRGVFHDDPRQDSFISQRIDSGLALIALYTILRRMDVVREVIYPYVTEETIFHSYHIQKGSSETYRVSNEDAWYVLDEAYEGHLLVNTRLVAGPFATREEAIAERDRLLERKNK